MGPRLLYLLAASDTRLKHGARWFLLQPTSIIAQCMLASSLHVRGEAHKQVAAYNSSLSTAVSYGHVGLEMRAIAEVTGTWWMSGYLRTG